MTIEQLQQRCDRLRQELAQATAELRAEINAERDALTNLLPHALTRRKTEVLHRVRAQLTNKQIAEELHITERTVKFHLTGLLAQYGVKHRREL